MRHLVAERVGVMRAEGLRPFGVLDRRVSDFLPETCSSRRRPICLRAVRLYAAVQLSFVRANCLDRISYRICPFRKLLGVFRESRVVELFCLCHFHENKTRKLRSPCFCEGGQIRLSRVELPGMIEVEAGDNFRGNPLDLNKSMPVAEVPDLLSRPEGVGVVRVNRVGFVLLAENNNAVCLLANITGVLADFDNEICRVCDPQERQRRR